MATEESDVTLVQMKKETALRIKSHAEFGDTYDDILTKMLDEKEKQRR